MTLRKLFLLLGIFIVSLVHAQDSTWATLPGGYLSRVSARVDALEKKIDKKSQQALREFQKSEARVYKKLSRIDSTKSAQFIASSKQQYQLLETKLNGDAKLTTYLPFLDTLSTSLEFLSGHREFLSKVKHPDTQLPGTFGKVKELQQELADAEIITQFLRQRRAQMKEQLFGLPFGRDLKKLNKQAYYYSAQVQEYREMLKDKKKIERKALEILSKTKAFQEFFKKNSELASLFRLTGEDGVGTSSSLLGLQSRSSVQQVLQSRLGSSSNAIQVVQQNVQGAQAQLQDLKNKVSQLGSRSLGSGSSEIELPDFTPNSQKTKSFFKRLEFGTDLQSQRAQLYFPFTSDLGLSLGYRLNDKSILGVGAAYKVGLGKSWQRIKVTHQGVGLRSFFDYKLKSTFFLSGGYEQNFRVEIKALSQLQDQHAWQKSGLLGLAKRYKVSNSVKGEVKLLWDFLSYTQVPRTQALLVRFGYHLK